MLHAVGGEIEDPRTHTTVRIPDEVALKVLCSSLWAEISIYLPRLGGE